MDDASRRYRLVRGEPGRRLFVRRDHPVSTVVGAVALVLAVAFIAFIAGPLQGTVIGTIPLLIALLMGLAYVQGGVRAVVDSRQRRVWRPRVETGPPWSVPFHDIHAVQVLRRNDEEDVGECNIVLTTGRRVHVLTQGGGAQMANDARRLSAQVGVPVWEAAVPPPPPMSARARFASREHDGRGDMEIDRRDAMASVFSLSGAALVLTNLGPLADVLVGDGSVLTVFTVYWWELVIVGAIGVLRLVVATPSSAPWRRIKAPAVPFFIIHYGCFVWIHGWAITSLYGDSASVYGTSLDLTPLLGALTESHIGYFVLFFAVSHGISFATNSAGRREQARPDLSKFMTTPYAAVTVMHLAIILSIIAFQPLTAPAIGLTILVGVKILADLLAHVVAYGERSVDTSI